MKKNSILAPEAFKNALSQRRGNDIFDKNSRLLAWENFAALPMPNRLQEAWRFAKIQNVELEKFTRGNDKISKTEAAEIAKNSNKINVPAGTMIFADGNFVAGTLSENARERGVFFGKISDAPAAIFEKISASFAAEKNLENGVPEKFEELHKAFSEEFLLFVPENARLENPFAVYNWSVSENRAAFPSFVVFAEKNSNAKFSEFYFSANKNAALVVSKLEIFAERGANFSHEILQNLNAKTHFHRIEKSHIFEGANSREISINIGAERSRAVSEICLEGRHGNAEIFSLAVGNAAQELDSRTSQKHFSPETSSRLLFKNVLLGNARTIFGGNIDVREAAQKTEAAQSNRNLILSPSAEAFSLPGLEIVANDVRCSHGATNSSLDPEQLFYLRQRGLSKAAARSLLIKGFAEEIVSKISVPELSDFVRKLVSKKMH